MCKQCGGDYVVGAGGSLECNRCGHIVGDISLLFGEKPFDEMSECPRLDAQPSEEGRESA